MCLAVTTNVTSSTVAPIIELQFHACSTIQAHRRCDVTFSDVIEAAFTLTVGGTITREATISVLAFAVVAIIWIQTFVNVNFTAGSTKIFSARALVFKLKVIASCTILTRIGHAFVNVYPADAFRQAVRAFAA